MLPLTPISESRDDVEWAKLMYHSYATSCLEDNSGCKGTGWSVLLMAMLATVGHPQLALEQSQQMPPDIFDGAAGNGHSLSNTLWYIATRPYTDALELSPADSKSSTPDDKALFPSEHVLTDCYRPESCTDYVLDTIAGLYSCRQRINWLIQERGKTQEDACAQVAGIENPRECGACDPHAADKDTQNVILTPRCPPCTLDQCSSDLNRCPRYEQSFVCVSGPSMGGCAPFQWALKDDQCTDCCELTNCPAQSKETAAVTAAVLVDDTDCPICTKDVCRARLNQCPKNGGAPFLCYQGPAAGGCSTRPWHLIEKVCQKCCEVVAGCEH
jgi:hypothetical protein